VSRILTQSWEAKRTDETRHVEDFLESAGFERVDAYRFNSASIRVRIVDPRFEGLADEKRDAVIAPFLKKLPSKTRADVLFLLPLAPSEFTEAGSGATRGAKVTILKKLLNAGFIDPSTSTL